MDFVDDYFAKGFKPSYVRNLLVAIRSWLGHFGLTIDRKIKLPTTDYVEETIPTKEEFSQILRHRYPRARVIASLMGFAGLRPQSISNYQGTDGLRLKDLPDLKIEGDKVIIEKTPMRVIVRRTLSKTRHQYMTFLIQEGCQYLIYAGFIKRDDSELRWAGDRTRIGEEEGREMGLPGEGFEIGEEAGDWHVIQTEDFYVKLKSDPDVLEDVQAHLNLLKRKISRLQAKLPLNQSQDRSAGSPEEV